MSNEAARHAREYLDLIKWTGQTWEAITYRMIDGGNQVLEKTGPEWNPALTHGTTEEIKERRICGNLESSELAIFIASAPSVLSNAAHAIENLEREIDKLKKEHEREINEANRKTEDWKLRRNALSDSGVTQSLHIAALEKKLSRYEKKRAKKARKK